MVADDGLLARFAHEFNAEPASFEDAVPHRHVMITRVPNLLRQTAVGTVSGLARRHRPLE
ncbi:hypothetical protein [Microvirga massiliensis]|uniref:hypothetical protein n=1 Tax=Microvirga massiliensis TaxID=1033741 RepID=UPI00062B7E3B|nr:hypothetical protein [Microvirga massiliensis]